MKCFDYVIQDMAGIHARPAGELVVLARGFSSEIMMEKDQKAVNLKNLMALLKLSVKQGETVTVMADGEDEEDAVRSIRAFMECSL